MTLTPFPSAFAGVGEPEKEASDSPASSSAAGSALAVEGPALLAGQGCDERAPGLWPRDVTSSFAQGLSHNPGSFHGSAKPTIVAQYQEGLDDIKRWLRGG